MDHIRDILLTFSEKEKTEFRHFLLRQKHNEQRKDLQLFNELSQTEIPQKKLAKRKGTDAYHSVRKRLMKHLADHIVLRQLNDESTDTGSITGLLSIARYLFEKGMPENGWKYLRKAEHQALQNDRYDLLLTVYMNMIDHAHHSRDYALDEILQRMEACKKLQEEDERLIIATAHIRRKLNELKSGTGISSFPKFVEDIIEQYKLHEVLSTRPKHLIQLMEIVRSTYLALRDLSNFEPLVKEKFIQFENSGVESAQKDIIRIQFLYMIAHCLFHNRKFEECLVYIEALDEQLKKTGGKFERNYLPRSLSVKCSILSLSGKNEEAIALLEKQILKRGSFFNPNDEWNLKLNLAFYYFNGALYKKANRVFIEMDQHSDYFYEKKMGTEWVIRSKMIRLIVQYELGNAEQSLQILSKLEKQYKHFFAQETYTRAKHFLSLIKLFLKDPYKQNYQNFRELAEQKLFSYSPSTEESKALAFFSWLKSKFTGADYYSTLLEEVNFHQDS
jgi:hypothetical protein